MAPANECANIITKVETERRVKVGTRYVAVSVYTFFYLEEHLGLLFAWSESKIGDWHTKCHFLHNTQRKVYVIHGCNERLEDILLVVIHQYSPIL